MLVVQSNPVNMDNNRTLESVCICPHYYKQVEFRDNVRARDKENFL